ncbi:MAG: hypothetical protein KDA78_04025 [Planctomycetaceae bacterium]|nr:hypothetical protein [Planctomycetaceae bacterium]
MLGFQRLAITLLCGLLATSQIFAEDVATPSQMVADSAEDLQCVDFLKKLQQSEAFEFSETPLNEALNFLSEKTGINFLLDLQALAEEGLAEDIPVSFWSQQITCRSALHHILRQHDLNWTVENEVVVIRPRYLNNEKLQSRFYLISSMLTQQEPVTEITAPTTQFGGGVGINQGFGMMGSTPASTKSSQTDRLIEVLQISPGIEWEETSGAGGSAVPMHFQWGDVLAIQQNFQAHLELMTLLSQLQGNKAATSSLAATELKYQQELTQRNQQIIKALDQEVQVQYQETPLNEAVTHLGQLIGETIYLEENSLADEGISPDVPVSLACAGISARSALKLLLGQAHTSLTYELDHECLMILSEVTAEEKYHTRVYDVSNLVAAGEIPAPLPGFGGGAFGGGYSGFGGGNGGFGGQGFNGGGYFFQLADSPAAGTSTTGQKKKRKKAAQEETEHMPSEDIPMPSAGSFGMNNSIWLEDALIEICTVPFQNYDGYGGQLLFYETPERRLLVVSHNLAGQEEVSQAIQNLTRLHANAVSKPVQ